MTYYCLTRASLQCVLFADDGTLNTANDNIDNIPRDLQQSLYDVSGWCCRNRMALNPTKTKCMLMATRQKHQKKKELPLNLKFETTPIEQVIVPELCESRGGRPGLSVLTSLLVSVDVKIYCTVLRHWSQLVPNMFHDI